MRRQRKRIRIPGWLAVYVLITAGAFFSGVFLQEGFGQAASVPKESSGQAEAEFQIEDGVLVKYRGKGPDVVIPKGVKEIGSLSFAYHKTLRSVVIPEGVESIQAEAFRRCTALKQVQFPESLRIIDNMAFVHCKRLEEVTIPRGVERVGGWAFSECNRLSKVKSLAEGGAYLERGIFMLTPWMEAQKEACTKENPYVILNGSILEVAGKLLGEEAVVPEGVTAITAQAFAGLPIKRVVLPESLDWIGEEAFRNCKYLEQVTMPSQMKRLENSIFYGCWKLRELSVPEGITELDFDLFRNCANLRKADLPEGLVKIGDSVFRGCKKLEEAKLPEGLQEIGYAAFSNCRRLKELILPEGVERIGSYAFWSCLKLEKIQIPDSVVDGGDRKTYYRTPWLERTLAELPEEELFLVIGKSLVLARENSKRSLEVPEGITKIGGYAFEGMELEEISLPDGITEIGFHAFRGCPNLKRLDLPDGIERLEYVCHNCPELEEVDLPKNLLSVRFGFRNCPKLKKMTVYQKLSYIQELVWLPVRRNVSEDFTVYVEPGSRAEDYAEGMGMEYRYLDSGLE